LPVVQLLSTSAPVSPQKVEGLARNDSMGDFLMAEEKCTKGSGILMIRGTREYLPPCLSLIGWHHGLHGIFPLLRVGHQRLPGD
jgi:hypothetical protein